MRFFFFKKRKVFKPWNIIIFKFSVLTKYIFFVFTYLEIENIYVIHMGPYNKYCRFAYKLSLKYDLTHVIIIIMQTYNNYIICVLMIILRLVYIINYNIIK